MKTLPRVFLLLFFTTGFYYAASQQLKLERFVIPDSLQELSFKQLQKKYNLAFYDSYEEKLYAYCMFKKAQNTKDSIALAWGYHALISTEQNLKKRESYIDTLLSKTKDWILQSFPREAFLLKSDLMEEMGDIEGAVDNLETAVKYAQQNGDEHNEWYIKDLISILKSNWGNSREALELDRSKFKYLLTRDNRDQTWKSQYLVALFNLSIGYVDIGELDSALIYTRKGYKESLNFEDSLNSKGFVHMAGIANYYQGNYHAAIDSMNSAFSVIKKVDPANFVFTYLYKGLAYYKLGKYPAAIRNLEQADSIYLATQYEFPELKELYQTFIDYYQKTGNTEKQLEYINKLLKADSILIRNYRYVGDNMPKKIDTPLYLAEKNKLLATANRKKKTWVIVAVVLGILLFAGGIFFYFYYKKQRLYKRRFTQLLANQDKKNEQPKTKTLALASDLPEALVKELLLKLKTFEIEKGYLEPRLSLTKLATALETNTAYLSKVINGYKQKSFSNYIHDLRIDYAIEALKTKQEYRLYSISGLAQEMGYSRPQTFTKAFYTKTGLYPSWFIKELEKSKAS